MAAVEAQRDGRHQRRGEVPEAERGGDGGGGQHVGGIENAERQLVADIGPGGLAHEVEGEALSVSEALPRRDMEQGGIEERDIADAQAPHLSSSAAVTMARAMSAILRFSFIAALRISW